MPTGYEVKLYADITNIHRELQSIAESQQRIADALERFVQLADNVVAKHEERE